MTQIKSSNLWHLIIRTECDEEIESLHLDITELLYHLPFNYILIGTERGKKEDKYHAHITFHSSEMMSDTTMRKRLRSIITQPYRLSIVRDLTKANKYTIKGQTPYFHSGYDENQIKEIIESWEPIQDFKKANNIINILQKKIDLTQSLESILSQIIDFYIAENKIFDSYKLQSVMTTLLARNEKYKQQLISTVLSKINFCS